MFYLFLNTRKRVSNTAAAAVTARTISTPAAMAKPGRDREHKLLFLKRSVTEQFPIVTVGNVTFFTGSRPCLSSLFPELTASAVTGGGRECSPAIFAIFEDYVIA